MFSTPIGLHIVPCNHLLILNMKILKFQLYDLVKIIYDNYTYLWFGGVII